MEIVKKAVLFILRNIKKILIIPKKIKISKNTKTRINDNESENISINIYKNEECEISKNKFK